MKKLMQDIASLSAAIANIVGQTVVDIRAINGGGYSPARRLVATLRDGSTAFVKAATEPLTAGWIAQERRVYEGFSSDSGVDFAPRYFGAGVALDAAGDLQPFLVLEDLSACHWPPPWSPARVEAVRAALRSVHATRGAWMADLPRVEEVTKDNPWERVARDPSPFLSLGLCSVPYLHAALPTLLDAAAAAEFSGDDLLHIDVRSDNLCLRLDGRACLVDWNWACRGNADFDTAAWLPSLHAEGGAAPETLLPGVPGYASWLAGYFAVQASLPPPPLAPRVREVQKQQLQTALPWAVRALNLPPLS